MPLTEILLLCLGLPPLRLGLALPFLRDQHPHRLNEHAATHLPPCPRSQSRSWQEPPPPPATFSTCLSRSLWRLVWENSTQPPRHSSFARCLNTYKTTTGKPLMDSLRTSLSCLSSWKHFALPLSLPPLLLPPLPPPTSPPTPPHGPPPTT